MEIRSANALTVQVATLFYRYTFHSVDAYLTGHLNSNHFSWIDGILDDNQRAGMANLS